MNVRGWHHGDSLLAETEKDFIQHGESWQTKKSHVACTGLTWELLFSILLLCALQQEYSTIKMSLSRLYTVVYENILFYSFSRCWLSHNDCFPVKFLFFFAMSFSVSCSLPVLDSALWYFLFQVLIQNQTGTWDWGGSQPAGSQPCFYKSCF